MNFKKLSHIADAVESTWDVVIAGMNGTEIGVVNSDRTKFKPYVGGHLMDGYVFEDSYGDWPHEESEETTKGIAEVASKWGVDPSDIEVGTNDEWEGGYLFVPSEELGPEVSVDPEWFDSDEENTVLAVDFYEDLYYSLPENEYWWWPTVNDQ